MPHSKQALKRMRQNERRRIHNRMLAARMKTALRRVREACAANDRAAAQVRLSEAMKQIDKCAESRVIHPNNASRKKSLVARQVAAVAAEA